MSKDLDHSGLGSQLARGSGQQPSLILKPRYRDMVEADLAEIFNRPLALPSKALATPVTSLRPIRQNSRLGLRAWILYSLVAIALGAGGGVALFGQRPQQKSTRAAYVVDADRPAGAFVAYSVTPRTLSSPTSEVPDFGPPSGLSTDQGAARAINPLLSAAPADPHVAACASGPEGQGCRVKSLFSDQPLRGRL